MSGPNGWNPIEWNCERHGCFNVRARFPIEEFAECFPGLIAMSDIDAVVEMNGHFLFFEFKNGEPRDIPRGQEILLERLTEANEHITAAVVFSDAPTRTISHIRVVSGGKWCPLQPIDLRKLKGWCSHWSSKVDRKPRVPRLAHA